LLLPKLFATKQGLWSYLGSSFSSMSIRAMVEIEWWNRMKGWPDLEVYLLITLILQYWLEVLLYHYSLLKHNSWICHGLQL
jgi:hypothetical protein